MPSRTFATAEQKIGSNPTEKYPYHTTYNDLDLTFLVDSDMSQKVFMDAWLEYINPSYNYNFKYKEDYATTITINQYDVTNELTYSINIYDAYPISMNQLDLDWGSDAAYHKMTVTFAYTYWEVVATAQVNHVLGAQKNSIFPLGAALQIGALALSSGKALTNGNPYALLSVAGAATSVIPSIGGTKTLSSVLNNSSRSSLDTALDQGASKVNLDKQSISGLTTSPNKFSF